MTTHTWIRRLFDRKPRTVRKAPARFRPRLEALEDRTLLNNYMAATAADLINDIGLANTAGGTNTITLTADTSSPYTVTAVDNTTDGPTGLPVIAAGNNLTIAGNGDTIQRSTAAGAPAFRLFDVAAGATLTLQSLTLQNGLALGSDVSAQGGAIYSQGTLSLDTVTLLNSTAQGSAGTTGAPGAPGSTGTAAWGGAIYVAAGSLTLNNSTLASDAAVGGAGGAGGAGDQATIGGPGGAGGSSQGGAIYLAAGTLTLTNATVSNDSAQGGVGGPGGIFQIIAHGPG